MSLVGKWLHAHTGLSNHIDKTNFVFSWSSCIDPANSIDDNFVLTLSGSEEKNGSRTISCSRCFDSRCQGGCGFSNTRGCCCKVVPSSLESAQAVSNHLKLPRSRFFVSEVRDFTSLNWVFGLTHIVRTMTTPLKDSVESLRYLESVVPQSGVYDTCGDPAVKRLAWNHCPPGRHPGGCGGRGVGVHGGRVVHDGHVHVS